MTKEEIAARAIALRREFHMHPEISLHEVWTAAKVGEELTEIGIPWENVSGNVIGTLKLGSGKGRRVVLRADFDALPMREENDFPWKSQYDGVMHACGHDAHTAIMLGTARTLYQRKDELNGTVYMVFQKGEEINRGATDCVAWLKEHGGADCAIGAHCTPYRDTGIIDISAGTRANGCAGFRITVNGRGGHGSRPDLVANIPEILCDLYSHLVKIPVNHHAPAQTTVVSICQIHAGDADNVFPNTGYLAGTVRFAEREDGQIILDKVRDTAEKIVAMHGADVEMVCDKELAYPVINDPASVAVGRRVAAELGFSQPDLDPFFASDNMSEFVHAFSGFYAFFGCRSKREGVSDQIHNVRMDLDEDAIPRMIDFFAACTEAFLEKEPS